MERKTPHTLLDMVEEIRTSDDSKKPDFNPIAERIWTDLYSMLDVISTSDKAVFVFESYLYTQGIKLPESRHYIALPALDFARRKGLLPGAGSKNGKWSLNRELYEKTRSELNEHLNKPDWTGKSYRDWLVNELSRHFS